MIQMSTKKRLTLFHVVTENKHGYHFTYDEDGYTAQDAVDNVRTYMDETEKVVFVFKQVENWK